MNPHAKPHLPLQFDLGDGLILRAPGPGDAEAVFAVVVGNREHLRVWLPWVDGSRAAQNTRDFLEQDAELRERGVTATYIILEKGEVAGFVGLHDIDPANRSFLIGYWLAKSSEGRGLITRSCRYLVTVLFERYGMERAVIRCDVRNARSAAIPQRLGFTLEGVERHAQRVNGEFIDLERYSLLRGESL